MSTQHPGNYVVTIRYHEDALTEVMKLNSTMIHGGYKTTMNDDAGQPHELGTNSFGIISASDENEITGHASALAEMALGKKVSVRIATLEEFLSQLTEKRTDNAE